MLSFTVCLQIYEFINHYFPFLSERSMSRVLRDVLKAKELSF